MKLKSLLLATTLTLFSGCQLVGTYIEIQTRNANYARQQLNQKYNRSGDIVPIRISHDELWVNLRDEGLESIVVIEKGITQTYDGNSNNIEKRKDFYWLRLSPIGDNFSIKINNKDRTISETFTAEKIKDSYVGEYAN